MNKYLFQVYKNIEDGGVNKRTYMCIEEKTKMARRRSWLRVVFQKCAYDRKMGNMKYFSVNNLYCDNHFVLSLSIVLFKIDNMCVQLLRL